jgi:hypothetical protein
MKGRVTYTYYFELRNSEKIFLSTFISDFECGSIGDVTAVSRSNVGPVSLTEYNEPTNAHLYIIKH